MDITRGRTLRRTLLAAVIGAGAVVAAANLGCERKSNKSIVLNPATRPAGTPVSRPVALVPPKETTQPAATQASAVPVKKSSYMNIRGDWFEFPEAKLILRKEGDHVVAFLTSNDPPDVLSPAYRGNRYYFELRMETVDDPKDLAQAEFRYKAGSAEPADTPNGIFLSGDRDHLLPYDIQVVFDRDENGRLIADIRGQFLFFEKKKVVGEMIPVMATLAAKGEVK
ncbi:MAG: hypothetical protein ACAI43_14675 [Phycisphaerae bacterium]|nr:hypothetical protein [Tepidisphaeraceae bacterium]